MADAHWNLLSYDVRDDARRPMAFPKISAFRVQYNFLIDNALGKIFGLYGPFLRTSYAVRPSRYIFAPR